MKVPGLALVSFLVTTASALGGDLRVTGMVLDMNGVTHRGTVTLEGARQFSFQGRVNEFAGVFDPGECSTGALDCAPGATMPLGAVWAGADLPGTATLDGIYYPRVGSELSVAGMTVRLTGSVVLPPRAGAPAIVSAPVMLAGSFAHPGGFETLVGAGTATVYLSPFVIRPGVWHVDRVVYRIGAELPPPWAAIDVGAVGISGTASYIGGTFLVDGAGGDIWDRADAFRFVYQPVVGDATIVARVVAEEATHVYAKAGVMFRDGSDPAASHVILDMKPDGGIELMTRYASGESTIYVAGTAVASGPWLKLVRAGARFTGYQSADGATWTEIGSVYRPDARQAFLAGLAVTSHDVEILNAALFDSVAVSGAVSAHNLLIDGNFETSIPPAFNPLGWVSDYPFRHVPAKSETNQPHAGTRNGACWSPEPLDCGLYQDRRAPVTGAYTLTLYATSDRPGGLVGVNINGDGVASREVRASGFANYQLYSIPFHANAGDTVRVWMYSPDVPGYVVIDDVSLTVDEPLVITGGSWENGGPGPFGSFTLTGPHINASGTYDDGTVEARRCNPCVPGQLIGLTSIFENQTPMTDVSFAHGWATTDGQAYLPLEFGGRLTLTGVAVVPAPTGTTYPQLVTVTAPFTMSGNLRGFDVFLRRDPLLQFDLPLVGRGTATLELIAGPGGPSGPSLTFHRVRYVFEPNP